MHSLRRFSAFAFLSGLGWLCDFGTYTLLVKVIDFPPHAANFVSSYVGVTFVWFTSLKSVFGTAGAFRGQFLVTYWVFQFLSISCYSLLLNLVAHFLQAQGAFGLPIGQPEILAKIIVTPVNLVTNFLFMKFLSLFMQQKAQA
ncbi:GtrA family protein [Candidatus Thiosymbion oneisti]|uniref:GtrA family protein n=1 Tax=Candidatus Thiosymbion oneisti TaxID=589554 RepID=UPI000AEBFCE6|nr:GtrA family protein [Candidatus Thiosymbion oneisti]